MGVDLILIGCEEGDWEGLYVNGKLFTEGHRIHSHNWIDLIQEYKEFSGEFAEYVFTEDQMEELGCEFPFDIKDIPKSYFK